MKSNQKMFWLFSVVIIATMLMAACAPAAPAAEPAAAQPAAEEPTKAPDAAPAAAEESTGPKIIRVGIHMENDTLNPFTSQMTGEATLPMIEGLVMSNDQNSYIPVLAKEIPTEENGGIETQADGKIKMTWHLQEGVKWHDGVEFTSEDVCFTWNWLVSDGATMVYNQMDYKNISACEMPDKYTVVFTWDVPYAKYQTLFDALLPKHVLEGQDVATYDAYNRSPVGTGPYVFNEWKAGEYLRMTKNPDYWRGTDYPKMDEMVYYFVPDPNTRLNGIKAGEYDIAELDSTMAKEVETLPDYKVEMVNRNLYIIFGYSVKSETGKALFSDKNVRQALFYAIDREAIVNDLLEGTAQVAQSPLTPSSPYFKDVYSQYTYDPEKAKAMLDEAGWVVGADGIREKDGVKFSFTMLGRASRPQRLAILQVAQAWFKEIGVEATIETLEDKAFIEKWVSGNWDATVAGWILPADPSVTGQYACDGSNNMTGLCDPELDELMNSADQTLAFDARKELMDQAQTLLAEDAFDLPIHYMTTPFALNKNFQNFKGSGTNLGSYWNVYEWEITE